MLHAGQVAPAPRVIQVGRGVDPVASRGTLALVRFWLPRTSASVCILLMFQLSIGGCKPCAYSVGAVSLFPYFDGCDDKASFRTRGLLRCCDPETWQAIDYLGSYIETSNSAGPRSRRGGSVDGNRVGGTSPGSSQGIISTAPAAHASPCSPSHPSHCTTLG